MHFLSLPSGRKILSSFLALGVINSVKDPFKKKKQT